ncbi:MAG: hypothetical protein HY554_01085 [Elusimicrobia bacterium]|nr:hypothetical protein [Elusimicrobiota bacterium]
MRRGGEQAAQYVVVAAAVCLGAFLLYHGARRLLARGAPPAPTPSGAGAGGVYLHPPAPAPKYGAGSPEAAGFEPAAAIPAIAISRTGRPTVRTTAPPVPAAPSDK